MSNLSLHTNFQLELRCKHHDVSINIKGYLHFCTIRNKMRWLPLTLFWPEQPWSAECHQSGSRLLQMLERSAQRLGHLKLFPGPWCQIETSTICPGHWTAGAGHQGHPPSVGQKQNLGICVFVDPGSPRSYSHLIPLCSAMFINLE